MKTMYNHKYLTMNKTKMIEKMKMLSISIFLGLVLLFTSCGESVDPVQGDVKMVMKATTTTGTINSGARVAESGIEFTIAMIGITEIELESLESSSDDGDDDSNDDGDDDSDDDGDDDSDDGSGNHHDGEFEIEYEGQFIVDLIAGTSDPDFGIADLFPGTYKEIELKLRPIMDDGNSLFIAFSFQPTSGDPVNVEISSKRELEFEVENHDGIQVEGNNLSQILLLFNLDEVLEGIDFSQADVDEDGVIRINDNSNVAFTGSVLSNFVKSCKSGEDDDHDHEFDDELEDDD
jgi:hypothetical protein